MIYRSNLTCPDLAPHFKWLHSRVMGHSFGHDVPSDWADKADNDPVFGIYKRCGFWTHDEAAILYNVAKIIKGWWLDIGCHTGWTSAHIAAGAHVECIHPMLSVRGFVDRWADDLSHCWDGITAGHYMTSNEFFTYVDPDKLYDGFCIDGDHEPGAPLQDAQNAAAHLAPTGVIMFHDGVGRPVREAVQWLMEWGFKARAYFTPHLVFCCWRGDFTPPDHMGDPEVKRQILDGRFADFDFGRME